MVETDEFGVDRSLSESMGSVSIGGAIRHGWTTFWGHWGFLVGLSLFYVVLAFVDGVISELLEMEAGVGVVVIWHIVSALFFGFIYLGYTKLCLNLIDGKPAGFTDLFSQYDKIVPWLVASILYFLAAMIGLVLLILPGIYVSVRFYFYDFLIVDQGESTLGCLKRSWSITGGFGNTMRLFGLIVVATLIGMAGMLACGIGMLFTVPIAFLATLSFYRGYLHMSEVDALV